MRLGLLVPTLNAGPRWADWLAALARQSRQPERVLVIDSQSDDDTARLAQEAGHELLTIRRADFDHGATRQLGLTQLADCEVVVCLTQDALLAGPNALQALLATFADPLVAVAYGRQLPHQDADPTAAHVRTFNYPPQSRSYSLDDRRRYGLKAAFCSNSFAAWRREALLAQGGFPSRTLLAEDMQATARLLMAGWRSAYVAEAQVYHSHNYSLQAEFRRYFDTGALHAHEPWLLETFGGATGEGLRYITTEWRALRATGWYWPLRGLLGSAAKFSGYKFGRLYRYLPTGLCRRLSMHPAWWREAHPPTRPVQ